MKSHGLLFRAKIATAGSNSDESSNVPSEMVTYPSRPLFRPKIGLPQLGQNTRVTGLPAFEVKVCSPIGPDILKRVTGTSRIVTATTASV